MPRRPFTTPELWLVSDPARLRELAEWADSAGLPAVAAAARRAAAELDAGRSGTEGPGR